MKFYIELTLKPQAEVPVYFLWEKVFQQVHLALVEMQDSERKVDIGVSFPKYDARQFELGCKLRLFSVKRIRLEELNIEKWLSRLLDYVHVSSIKEVPQNIESYALFKRQQVKSSITRLARRKVKRHGIDYEEALVSLGGFEEKQTKAPFIQMDSLSSEMKKNSDGNNDNPRHKFRLFIVKQSFDHQQQGTFNCYGLSQQATVPWF